MPPLEHASTELKTSSARPTHLNPWATPRPASIPTARRGRRVGTHKLKNFAEDVDSIRELVQSRRSTSPSEWREKLAVCLNGELHRVLRERDFLLGGRNQDMVGLLHHATDPV